MATFAEDIRNIYDELKDHVAAGEKDVLTNPSEKIQESINQTAKAWSGSWLGYQSRVYYKDLQSPPPGAHFSSEWGLRETFSYGTTGDWVEYPFDTIVETVHKMVGSLNLKPLKEYSEKSKQLFERCLDELVINLVAFTKDEKDEFLSGLIEKSKKIKVYSQKEFSRSLIPKHNMSRDSIAVSQGIHTPPHIWVSCELAELGSPKEACSELAKISLRAASYIEKIEKKKKGNKPMGKKIFIGHGQSKIWKELKEFLHEKLNLEWDEYNRVPTAGIATSNRLEEMLDSSSFAFLVMTAEDETPDGKLNARLNVIHEVGLFQGRLGFKKAIILLEESCDEFSNIKGLGQIRFPKGNISASFEEIRDVLKRESIIN